VAVVSWIADVTLLVCVCVCACRVDRVIVMDKGGIVHQGRYADLVAAGVSFASLEVSNPLDADGSTGTSSALVAPSPAAPIVDLDLPSLLPLTASRSCSTGSDVSEDYTPLAQAGHHAAVVSMAAPGHASFVAAVAGQTVQLEAGKAIEAEERYVGVVSTSVYKKYGQSLGGLKFAVGFLVVSVTLEAARTGTNLWLAQWSDHPDSDTTQQLAVYVSLGIATALLSMVRNFSWFHATYVASGRLHEGMLCGVLRSPMSWFNATPQGRILNRFSKDLDVIDQNLPDVISDLILCLLEVGAAVL
jgi:hypothetical protein